MGLLDGLLGNASEVNLTPECAMGVQQALASNLFK